MSYENLGAPFTGNQDVLLQPLDHATGTEPPDSIDTSNLDFWVEVNGMDGMTCGGVFVAPLIVLTATACLSKTGIPRWPRDPADDVFAPDVRPWGEHWIHKFVTAGISSGHQPVNIEADRWKLTGYNNGATLIYLDGWRTRTWGTRPAFGNISRVCSKVALGVYSSLQCDWLVGIGENSEEGYKQTYQHATSSQGPPRTSQSVSGLYQCDFASGRTVGKSFFYNSLRASSHTGLWTFSSFCFVIGATFALLCCGLALVLLISCSPATDRKVLFFQQFAVLGNVLTWLCGVLLFYAGLDDAHLYGKCGAQLGAFNAGTCSVGNYLYLFLAANVLQFLGFLLSVKISNEMLGARSTDKKDRKNDHKLVQVKMRKKRESTDDVTMTAKEKEEKLRQMRQTPPVLTFMEIYDETDPQQSSTQKSKGSKA